MQGDDWVINYETFEDSAVLTLGLGRNSAASAGSAYAVRPRLRAKVQLANFIKASTTRAKPTAASTPAIASAVGASLLSSNLNRYTPFTKED